MLLLQNLGDFLFENLVSPITEVIVPVQDLIFTRVELERMADELLNFDTLFRYLPFGDVTT